MPKENEWMNEWHLFQHDTPLNLNTHASNALLSSVTVNTICDTKPTVILFNINDLHLSSATVM
jgi:hypothetical protein